MEQAIKKNLILFMTGKLTAVLGSSIFSFTVGLYILAETGSSLNFAITLLLSTLPRVLLSPIAGTLSDRWDRKKIIIFSDFACAVWIGVILALFTFVSQDIWVLYLSTFILNILNVFYSSAVVSAVHNTVGPDHIQKAMSLNQAVSSLSTILGPVLGGILFGILPLHDFMVINMFTFLVSAIASVFIQYNLFAEPRDQEQTSSVLADLKSGLAYVRTQPFIKQLISISIWINFWFAVFPVAMPYLVLTIRHMSSTQFGIIEGSFSVGFMLMAIFMSTRPEMKRKDIGILGGIAGLSILLILMGLPSLSAFQSLSNTTVFIYLISLVFILSILLMIVNMPIGVLMQKHVPDQYRGRVNSLLETGATAMTPLGYILFGSLLEKMPSWLLLGICGLSILALIAYHIWKKTFVQQLQSLDQAIQPVVEG
ncbi:MFS transporter [Bacillus testis]|uniref:MFS transporter n=1 Tax=Bacillus testis TaxID=1622072 RepID=UPI00067E8409|nr:MFS transporter [Bacillus testis]